MIEKFSFKSADIFNELEKHEFQLVQQHFKPLKFKKNQLIFHEEGIPTGVYLLNSGRAKIYKTRLNGKEQIFYIYQPGDLLGYHALLCNEPYEDGCVAIENCILYFIEKTKFYQLLSQIPHLKELLIQNMSHEFGVMVNTITVMAQKPLRERLALFLLMLKEKYSADKNNQHLINLSRMDLANLVGTTRESLTRQLKSFEEEKLIEIKGRSIRLINEVKLRKLSVI